MSIISKVSGFFRKNNTESPKKKNIVNFREYTGKFVKQNAVDIGESVAIENNRVIVKSKDTYMAIPVEKITSNTDVIAVGGFDMDESLKFGKEWSEKRDTLKFDDKGMMILDAQKPQ
ncbi:Uncharacterised protein [uncultured archaeon]|nr:Uncharacterised protein [uncultured archaeon]